MSYLRTNDIPFRDISLTYVINFLAFLFYHKNLSPKTVAQYRTTLAKPLWLYFGIDLIVPAIADLLKVHVPTETIYPCFGSILEP